jgi:F-type H+-transporting ATPase subunit b
MIQLNPQIFILGGFEWHRTLFSMDLQTFLDMLPNLFNFVLVVAFLSYLLYRPVKNILQARADRVAGELADAENKHLTAQELKAKYEQLVSDIENERKDIISEANKQAGDRRTQILNEAKAEAQDVKDRAAKDIATEREQIKSAVVEAIVDISTDMAARLITTGIDKAAHDKLFDEALIELEGTTAFRTDTVAV